jgi:hypothetical protein
MLATSFSQSAAFTGASVQAATAIPAIKAGIGESGIAVAI